MEPPLSYKALQPAQLFPLVVTAREEEQGWPEQDEAHAHGPGVAIGFPALLSGNLIDALADADPLYADLMAVVPLILERRDVGR